MNLEQLLQHREFLTSLARGLVQDPLAQEELLWETMGEGALHPPDHSALKPWLARVLIHRAHARRRAERRRLRHEQTGSQPDRVESAAEVAARLELIQDLAAHVQSLDTDLRDVVLFRFFENLPPREIAVRLDLPVETVKQRLRRALALLRARLDTEHGSRDKWLGSLIPLAWPGAKTAGVGLTTTGLTTTGLKTLGLETLGALMMTAKTKATLAAIALLFLLGVGILYAVIQEGDPSDAGGRVLIQVPADSSPQEDTDPEASQDSGNDGGRRATRIRMEATIDGEIEGRVVDPLSEPVAGARITLHRSRDIEQQGTQAPVVARARSDERGAFRLSGLDRGTYIVRALADGLGAGQIHVGLTKQLPERVGWILRLHQCDTVAGVVVDPAGKAVAEAWIVAQWSHLRGGGLGGMGTLEVRSDEKGRFTFPSIPMGATVRFVAWSSGRMLGIAEMVVGQSSPPRIVLPEMGPYGMVFSLVPSMARESKPPDDVVVQVKLSAIDQLVPLPSPIRKLAVPAQGTIRLQGLREGTYTIIVSSGEVAFEKRDVRHRLTKDQPEAKVELKWGTKQVVEGRLVFKNGEPASGILLLAPRAYPFEDWEAKTNDEGHFAFPRQFSADAKILVCFGERSFLFETGGSPSWSIQMSPGVPSRVLTILRAPRFSGRVVNDKGKPVLGALVWLRASGDGPLSYGMALSNRKGEFQVSLTGTDRDSLLLGVTHESMFFPDPLLIEAKSSSSRDGLVLRMVEAGSIGGTILDEKGHGIAGVMVTADFVPPGEGTSGLALTRLRSRARWIGVRRSAFTDRQGRFRVLGLAPGRWMISVDPLGREEPKKRPILRLAAGEMRLGVRIVLRRGLSIQGRVVTDAGEAIGNVWITSFFSGRQPRGMPRSGQPIRTASDGSFVLKGLHPGAYNLMVQLPLPSLRLTDMEGTGPDRGQAMIPSSMLTTRVAAGTQDFRWAIPVPHFGKIQARLAQSGVPLQRIQVEMHSDEGTWNFDMPVRQGAMSMKRVLAGSYDLTFKSPRFADLKLKVTVHPDQVNDLGTLKLLDLAEHVEGRVVDQDGNPLAGVWIGLDEKLSDHWPHYDEEKGIDQFHGRVLVQSDARGRFRVPMKDRIRVLAFKPGYGPEERSYPSLNTPKGSPRKELILMLSRAAELSIQTPVSPKANWAGWSAQLTRLRLGTKRLVSTNKLVPEVLPVRLVHLVPGKTIHVIGLRPGTYRLEAMNRNKIDSYRKKSVPGESYYEEFQLQVGTKRLIKIP